MAKMLNWEHQPGATYTWVLGLHYYAEEDGGTWQPVCMVNDRDIWMGPLCNTRAAAESAAQDDFNRRVAEWV